MWAGLVVTLALGGGAAMGDSLEAPHGPVHAVNPVCADGPTLRGIDVSEYQGVIDWDAVAADGVDFAFIRVSHSTIHYDDRFDVNWEQSQAAGVTVGVYQYYEPAEDPIAQADLMLAAIGDQPGDLPPVIDVETAGGLSGDQIAASVQTWIDHVEDELGVRPIIYTGSYFWNDVVASDAFVDYPLWIAHYFVECPLTPTPWTRWTFHQHSDSGTTGGISGPVDQNVFNGTLDDLLALGSGEVPVCGTVAGAGATLDNGDDCYQLFGNADFWREEAAGYGGSLVWTNATEFESPANYGVWSLWFDEVGEYEVEVHIAAEVAESQRATYLISHGAGETAVELDQSAVDGWVSLGAFMFGAGTPHRVRLDDNTGELNADELAIVFDALRVTRVDGGSTGVGEESTSGVGSSDDTGLGAETQSTAASEDGDTSSGGTSAAADEDSGEDGCGCRTHTRPGAVLVLLAFVVRRRRSRPR